MYIPINMRITDAELSINPVFNFNFQVFSALISSVNALNAPLAPSPIEIIICLNGTVVTSPTA